MQTTGETPTFIYSRKPQPTAAATGTTTQTRKKDNPLPTFTTLSINKSFEAAKASITNKKNLFGDLITQGDLIILFGRSNVGKSFLAYQIAEAITKGKNVLDIMNIIEGQNNGATNYYDLNNETPAQTVLYVDFEGTAEKNFYRYTAKGKDTPYVFSENLFISYPDKLCVQNPLLFVDAIEQETIKTGAKVVLIDNLSAISQDNEKSGNAVQLMNKIKDFQRNNNLTVVLMAHTPKIQEGQPITDNSLAGSKMLFNLADAVFAVNTTTQSPNIRYIKQLKSRYNEKAFEGDNVITMNFAERLDGFKGFEFNAYNSEDALIKIIEKTLKEEEQEEIINCVQLMGMSYTEIAKELQPKYGKDVDLKTYRERIAKMIQRMKAKGLIKEETQPQKPATIEPQKPEPSQREKKQTSEALTPVKSTFEAIATHGSSPAASTPAINTILERQREREAKEQEEDLKALLAEIEQAERKII